MGGVTYVHTYTCVIIIPKFSNTTSVGKNWKFNQVHGRFTLPPSSFFLNYALLPPHVSVLFNLILLRRLFQVAYFSLWLVPLPAVSVHCLMYRPSPAMNRKNFFFSSGQMASRDLLLSHHSQTDKCKNSIMILYC